MVKTIFDDLGRVGLLGERRPQKSVSKAVLRRIVWKRDKGICQICHTKIRPMEVWDLARNRAGQPYTERNCFVAHHDCNISQRKKTRKQVLRELGVNKKTHRNKSRRKRRRQQNYGFPEIKIPQVRIPRVRF